jgi:hypothetical protein
MTANRNRPLRFQTLLRQVGVGLAVLCLGGIAEQAMFGKQLMQRAVAEGEDGQPGIDGSSLVNVVLVGQAEARCEAARQRLLAVAPEVLALAAWPLDDKPPAECLAGADDGILPAAVEVAGHPAVVSVMAYDPVVALPMPAIAGATPTPPTPVPATVGRPAVAREAVAAETPRTDGILQVAALDASVLDEIRGGFELAGSNLSFSFGIERAVYINGELVASTVLNIRDLQVVAGTGTGGATLILPASTAGALGIIQNGAGNSATVQVNPNIAGTVIQNTLNNQRIQNVTTINATVNSMQMMRAMSMQSAIQGGIVGSLRR